jgi:hypothetical protein
VGPLCGLERQPLLLRGIGMSTAELEREVASSFTRSTPHAALVHATGERLLQKGLRIVRALALGASAIFSACSPVASQQPVASIPAPNHVGSREAQPMSIMERAAKATSDGQTELALRDYLWALDYGVQVDSAFIGVRDTKLIQKIIALGAAEPSAMTELESRAARLERSILTSGATDVGLYVALNRERNQRERTLGVYHQLRQQGSPVPDDLYEDTFELLLEQRRYSDTLDREAWWTKSLAFKQSLITTVVASFRARSADAFEALAGTNRNQDALALLARVEPIDSSAESYVTFMKRALRAGNKELALLVLRRGRERALPEQQPSLTQVAGELGLD